MNKVLKSLALLLCSFVVVFSQKELTTENSQVKLCWQGLANDSAYYILYYYNLSEPAPVWKQFTSTRDSSIIIDKIGQQQVVFGVQTVLFNDSSEIHSSLDTNACLIGVDCVNCDSTGAWYLSWKTKIKKPKYLIKMEVYENY